MNKPLLLPLMAWAMASAGVTLDAGRGGADMAWLHAVESSRLSALGEAGVALPAFAEDALSSPLAGLGDSGVAFHLQRLWLPARIDGTMDAFSLGGFFWHQRTTITALSQSYADLDGYDDDGKPYGAFGAGNTVLALASSFVVASTHMGLRLSWIHGTIAEYSADALSLDAHIRRSLAEGLSAGVRVRHLGSGDSYLGDGLVLPLELQAGLALRQRLGARWSLVEAVDLRHRNDEALALPVGAALNWADILELRLGVDRWHTMAMDQGILGQYPSAGLGLRTGGFTLDYAYRGRETVRGMHQLGVGMSF